MATRLILSSRSDEECNSTARATKLNLKLKVVVIARKLRLLRTEHVFAFILAVAASSGEERLLLFAQLANVVVEVGVLGDDSAVAQNVRHGERNRRRKHDRYRIQRMTRRSKLVHAENTETERG